MRTLAEQLEDGVKSYLKSAYIDESIKYILKCVKKNEYKINDDDKIALIQSLFALFAYANSPITKQAVAVLCDEFNVDINLINDIYEELFFIDDNLCKNAENRKTTVLHDLLEEFCEEFADLSIITTDLIHQLAPTLIQEAIEEANIAKLINEVYDANDEAEYAGSEESYATTVYYSRTPSPAAPSPAAPTLEQLEAALAADPELNEWALLPTPQPLILSNDRSSQSATSDDEYLSPSGGFVVVQRSPR